MITRTLKGHYIEFDFYMTNYIELSLCFISYCSESYRTNIDSWRAATGSGYRSKILSANDMICIFLPFKFTLYADDPGL